MDYQTILNKIQTTLLSVNNTGKVATYIPELESIDPKKFGMHLYCNNAGHYSVGDHQERFSIQSISKVFALTLTLSKLDYNDFFKRVDFEPSGDPFNSLVQLEHENGRPRNPFINAGALVISDLLISHLDKPKEDFLTLIHTITGDKTINFNKKVYASEKKWSYRNASLLNLMKSFDNIHNDLEEVLDFYIYQCAIEMSCKELATAFMIYANRGKTLDNIEIISPEKTKRINAIMQTCGFYDEAGEFSFKVGLPGKSGVGGGIAAIHPGQYAVTVWSPPLNPKGNSELGMLALEKLTTLTGYSIF
ncbi:glutaminase B [Aquimarina addita]|uniref:Glutaminase n=1 Tax=Aquimarina addita TaxID=870485 RepID=A0ABP7X9N6_9FLAO